MPYTNQNGFVPSTFQQILNQIVFFINTEFGTTYTVDTIVGTGFYRVYYPVIQYIISMESTFGEAYNKLEFFFVDTNQKLQLAKITESAIINGLIAMGYKASIRQPTIETAGILAVAVDVDNTLPNYASVKTQINQFILDHSAGGLFYAGTEESNLVLDNGQAWAVRFALINKIPMKLKLTLEISKNTDYPVDDVDTIKEKLITNLATLYRMGLNFEPERYFEIVRDAPYCARIELEYSLDGGTTYTNQTKIANYQDFMYLVQGADDVSISFN